MNFNILHGQSNNIPSQNTPGNIYITENDSKVFFDIDNENRIELTSIFIVSEIPENPIQDKLYLIKPNKLGVYTTKWHWLNDDSNNLLKPSEFSEGNLVMFDGTGNIVDSKMKFILNDDNSLSLQINV